MHNDNDIKITTYDRLLRAWENSMELTRDFRMYSKHTEDDDKVRKMFEEFAKDEGIHAAELREMLLKYIADGKNERCENMIAIESLDGV